MSAAAASEMLWLPLDDTPRLDAAVLYAEHGFRVHTVHHVRDDGSCSCNEDCTAKGKHPIGGKWQERTTSNVKDVRAARARHALSNIGLAMGGPMRLLAVDIDGPIGRASWAELEAAHGAAPLTLTSSTGRIDGGEHRIFRVPDHLDISKLGNRASWAKPKVDTRIDNGQIVVAPSVHETGARYRWTVREPIADLPEALYHALITQAPKPEDATPIRAPAPPPTTPTSNVRDFNRPYFEAALNRACEAIANAGEGGRNQLVFAKSTTIFEYVVGAGFDRSEAWSRLGAAGIACGLPKREVAGVLNKAWAKAQANPRHIPPPKHQERPAPPTATAYPENWEQGDAAAHHADTDQVDDSWKDRLQLTNKGGVKPNLLNVTTILVHDPAWREVLAYDAFAECVVTTKPPPTVRSQRPANHAAGEWKEADSTRTQMWLADMHYLDVHPSMVDQAVLVAAYMRVIHPVRDYLNALTWDGTPRLDRFFVTHFGAEDTPYTRGVGSRWMISAVARIFEPGCQADCTIVLESKTGRGKSTALEALASKDWFADTGISIGDKDSYQCLRRKWIYELGELDSIKGREITRVKNFLSARSDNYRPSFGHRNADFPRQVLFAGTTEESRYLADRMGNRRFWPVKLTAERDVDVAGIRRDRDQLWAEAVARYRNHEPWHVNTPEFKALCEEQQSDRVQDDPWEQIVNEWLRDPWVTTPDLEFGGMKRRKVKLVDGFTSVDVLVGALHIRSGDITKAHEMRLAESLRVLGFESVRQSVGGVRERRYIKTPAPKQVGQVGQQVGQGQVLNTNTQSDSYPTYPTFKHNNQSVEQTSYPTNTDTDRTAPPELTPMVGQVGQAARLGQADLPRDDESPFADWLAEQAVDGERHGEQASTAANYRGEKT